MPRVDAGDVEFQQAADVGARAAADLRAAGADVVIALTHMRTANDVALGAAVPGIDLILGGHECGTVTSAAPLLASAVVRSSQTPLHVLTGLTWWP